MRRVFGLLLCLFPANFRERFGDAMRADLEDDWNRRAGLLDRLRFLLRLVPDVGAAAVAEWRRESSRGGRRHPGVRPAATPSRGWDGLAHDARHAVVQMLRNPLSSAVTVLTLALGLGIVTAVYALVDGVLLEPLPYPEPERLVRVWTAEADGEQRFLQATWDEIERFGSLSSFRSVAAFSVAPRDLLDEFGQPSGIEIARVSAGFLETLGAQPAVGRGFDPGEAADGAAVVLVAHGFWRSRYGGDESVLGESVSIQGVEHVVVGVLPATFDIPHGVAFWRPFTAEENQDEDRELVALARLADDATLHSAEAELAALFAGGVDARVDQTEAGVTAWIQPVRESLVREVRQPLWMLLAAVAGLLLLTCSNVAHLQLARVTWRTQEIAVRSALGAEPHRLFRLLLFENLALATAAGGLGLGLGHALLGAFRRFAPPDFPRLAEVGVDLRVVLLLGGAALVSGILAAWIPARRCAGVDPVRDLKVRTPDSGRWTARGLLVTAQVALATLLTVSAGLLFTSIGEQLDVDHGVELDGVVRFTLSPPAGADEPEDRPRFYRRMSQAVAELPGVVSAGLGNHDALQDDGWRMPFTLPDSDVVEPVDEADGAGPRVVTRVVDRAWIEAAGLNLLAGRNFDESLESREMPEGSVIVDRAFVRSHLGLDDPANALGRQLSHPAFFDGRPSTHRIVGVVETVRAHAGAEIAPKIYLPYSEFPWPRMHLLVKVEDDAVQALVPRIRSRIWSLEPTVAIGPPETFAAAVARRVEHRRFQLRLMAGFSYLALLLATVGIYAMLAFHIERRLPEIGLRRAFGADGLDIVRRVLGQALRLVLPGLAVGLVGAYFAGRVLASQLYGVAPVEPAVWALVVASILLATLLAALAPLRRALRLQPTRLLQPSS